MYSFSSASQMCEPFPRTINGGSPPTEPNARTGEFTPPGIMLSARCCRRRDCSVFRDVVDGIKAPTKIDFVTTAHNVGTAALGCPSSEARLRATDYYTSLTQSELTRYSS